MRAVFNFCGVGPEGVGLGLGLLPETIGLGRRRLAFVACPLDFGVTFGLVVMNAPLTSSSCWEATGKKGTSLRQRCKQKR
jgi:hypothetical protein